MSELKKKTTPSYSVFSFNSHRQFLADFVSEGKKKNLVYLFFQVDITDALRFIDNYKKKHNTSISFTSFIIKCFSQAVNENKSLQAIRKGNKLFVFDDVDTALIVEKEHEGIFYPILMKIDKTNEKDIKTIQEEIKREKNKPADLSHRTRFRRKLEFWVLRHFPMIKKQAVGTIGVTSIGMFDEGAVFPLPIAAVTIFIGIGTVQRQYIPRPPDDKMELRDMLCATLVFDHDIIDGGPGIRFLKRLKELITSNYGLDVFQV